MSSSTAFAHTNIALIKYWGKRHAPLNLPATGSLSLTLQEFGTQTTVTLTDHETDSFFLDGEETRANEVSRVSSFLDLFRSLSGRQERCEVRSINQVPTAAGLASSASAFAALAMATNDAFGAGLDTHQLSIMARRGSGSAARSLFGGFVRMNRGSLEDGSDSFAVPVAHHPSLDVQLIVVKCAQGRKKVGSTDGMTHTSETSPYFQAWVDTHLQDLEEAESCIRQGDLKALGEVMEYSTLKMHASGLAARPGLWYFTPTTIGVINEVVRLRQEGAQCWFTMDAGPHVKVLVPRCDAASISDALSSLPGVLGVVSSGPGGPAHILPQQD